MTVKICGKNGKTLVLAIVLAIILLIIIITLGSNLVKIESLSRRPVLTIAPPDSGVDQVRTVKPAVRRIEPEPQIRRREESIDLESVAREARKKQMDQLKSDIRSKAPASRPGKFPTLEEMEEIENKGTLLY